MGFEQLEVVHGEVGWFGHDAADPDNARVFGELEKVVFEEFVDEVVGSKDVCLEDETEVVCGLDADLLDLVGWVGDALDGVCAALYGGTPPVDACVDALGSVEVDVVDAAVGVVELVCCGEDGDHVCEVDEGVVKVEDSRSANLCCIVFAEEGDGVVGVGESS